MSTDPSEVAGINDSGQVVGLFKNSHQDTHAFITGPDGVGITDLGAFRTTGISAANDINDSGQVVGFFNVFDMHAFITGPDGVGMIDLGTLGGRTSHAYAVNDSGEVIGNSTVTNGDSHAFLYNHGGMTDLSCWMLLFRAGGVVSGSLISTTMGRSLEADPIMVFLKHFYCRTLPIPYSPLNLYIFLQYPNPKPTPCCWPV